MKERKKNPVISARVCLVYLVLRTRMLMTSKVPLRSCVPDTVAKAAVRQGLQRSEDTA